MAALQPSPSVLRRVAPSTPALHRPPTRVSKKTTATGAPEYAQHPGGPLSCNTSKITTTHCYFRFVTYFFCSRLCCVESKLLCFTLLPYSRRNEGLQRAQEPKGLPAHRGIHVQRSDGYVSCTIELPRAYRPAEQNNLGLFFPCLCSLTVNSKLLVRPSNE